MLKKFDYKIKYAVMSGFIFLSTYLVFRSDYPTPENHVNLCIFHYVTGYPCTACGTGRSLIYMKYGHFKEALLTNPIGYLVLAFAVLSLLWMGYDIIKKKETFFKALNFKMPTVLIVLIAVITIINWIWNIYKEL